MKKTHLISHIFNLILYFKLSNDFGFNYILARDYDDESIEISSNHEKLKIPPGSHDVLLNLCNWQKRSTINHTPCYITFIPCGDLLIWSKLKNSIEYRIERGNSLLNVDEFGHLSLLRYREDLAKTLNKINSNIIEIKKLMLFKRYNYLKNIYNPHEIEFIVKNEKYFWEHPTFLGGHKKCEYIELNVRDKSSFNWTLKTMDRVEFESIESQFPLLFKEDVFNSKNSYESILEQNKKSVLVKTSRSTIMRNKRGTTSILKMMISKNDYLNEHES